ncbi:patatin-like phospholipase family protein, partial [Gemmatimonas sp.]|uniref:patatin-like phospholipase family protein n=1 Tax=Gemmatimonas sp. TaxID=1962908 RepID=UPI0037BF7301
MSGEHGLRGFQPVPAALIMRSRLTTLGASINAGAVPVVFRTPSEVACHGPTRRSYVTALRGQRRVPNHSLPAPMLPPAPVTSDLGMVLGGGGARGAYQVGVLHAIAARYPTLQVPILVGVSAGAVNATHLAAHRGTFAQ